jgi:TIR domain
LKPLIFISHMSSDGDLAIALGEMFKEALLDGIDVFNASDRGSLRPGDPWRDEIVKNIRASEIMLVICSPESISRPWINFEAGAGWISDKRVVPCCVGGMKPSSLPAPLGHLQAIDLGELDDLKSILRIVAGLASLRHPDNFDFTTYRQRMERREAVSAPNAALVDFLVTSSLRAKKHSGQRCSGVFELKNFDALSKRELVGISSSEVKVGDSIKFEIGIEGGRYSGPLFVSDTTSADEIEAHGKGQYEGTFVCLGLAKEFLVDVDFTFGEEDERNISYRPVFLVTGLKKVTESTH